MTKQQLHLHAEVYPPAGSLCQKFRYYQMVETLMPTQEQGTVPTHWTLWSCTWKIIKKISKFTLGYCQKSVKERSKLTCLAGKIPLACYIMFQSPLLLPLNWQLLGSRFPATHAGNWQLPANSSVESAYFRKDSISQDKHPIINQ